VVALTGAMVFWAHTEVAKSEGKISNNQRAVKRVISTHPME